jgi:iron complex transport system substrate-binding protein
MASQPNIYIGTAIGAAMTEKKFPKYIALGPETSTDAARASLARSLERTGLAQLAAARSGRAFTLWHHFYNTPMHVAAVQAMAKWFHPDRFRDLDPDRTLAEYFRRFQPVPLTGVYWAGIADP